jgi:adhesin transport system outer membrane protein
VADTANSIALRTVQAYFEVHRAGSVLVAAERNLSALQRLQSRVASRVNAGHSDASEATEAGSRVAQAQALVIEGRARLADAKALFRTVVGRKPGQLAGAAVPRGALPRTVLAAVQVARDAAPSVIATSHDTGAATAAIGAARSRLYPKLNVEVSGYYGRGIAEAKDLDMDARAMLVMRWNIFNGGINRARINEASERAGEARSIADNTRRIVERETRVSWNAMQSANAKIPALRRRLSLLRSTRTTYTRQFATGARRLLDLLDAQSEVFTADAALRTETFIGQYNSFRVLAAMGRLVWVMGLELSDEATRPHREGIFDRWTTTVSK